ncbi:MAG: hypothetical protein R2719_11075 [Micropruina sp.]
MTGAGLSRLLDALAGAGVALLFTPLQPGDLVRRPRRYVANVLTELAVMFGMLGQGLRTGNRESLRDAHAQLRGLHTILDDATTVWKSSAEIVPLNPAMRRYRVQMDELGRQLELSTRAVHTAEVLLRQSRGMVAEAGADVSGAQLMDDAAATPQRPGRVGAELAVPDPGPRPRGRAGRRLCPGTRPAGQLAAGRAALGDAHRRHRPDAAHRPLPGEGAAVPARHRRRGRDRRGRHRRRGVRGVGEDLAPGELDETELESPPARNSRASAT